MIEKVLDVTGLLLSFVGVWLIFSGGGALPFVPTKGSLVVMLYEADHGPLPPYALGAANELTAAGRDVRTTDDDVLTGLGTVPAWLGPALEKGRAIMGSGQVDDALVLLSGERVVKAIKLPATKAEILEAVK